jgi:hypothetical protein
MLGRFPDVPLMEDIEIVNRARSYGRVHILDAAAVTSGRRWKMNGALRNTLLNQAKTCS